MTQMQNIINIMKGQNMKPQTKEKICNKHHELVYSQPFAQWAKPKNKERTYARTWRRQLLCCSVD